MSLSASLFTRRVRVKYGLPLNPAIGDRLYWLSTGVYTTRCSDVEFKGFPPLKWFYV